MTTVGPGPRRPAPSATWIALVAAAYVVTGRLGIAAALQQVTSVWPPSGLALAAVLLLGPRAAAGVALGSFLLNFGLTFDRARPVASVAVVAAMAVGSTIECLVGRALLLRFARGAACLDRAADVFRFVALAGLLSPTLAATIGAAALTLGGPPSHRGFGPIWSTWWIGDAVGVFVVAPLLLAWAREPRLARDPWRWAEALLLGGAVLAVALTAFRAGYPVETLAIPCLVWAAFSFGARGATLLTVVLAGIAVWGTVHGHGTFARTTLGESLAFLQTFVGVVAVSSLALCAVLAERAARSVDLLRAMEESTAARVAAESANRAKTLFLANMSHELRTPLNHIIGYAEMLQEDAEREGRAEAVSDLKKVVTSARSLLGVLHSILDAARLEAGTIDLTIGEFDLSSVVYEVRGLTLPLAEANGNTLEVRVANGIGPVRGDREKVRQALLHVVDNACKFTRNGAISVAASRETWGGRPCLAIVVSDTGIGLGKEEIDGIFRPFVQVDASPTRRYGGLGLGLSIARQFLQMLDGDLSVTSVPGQGSTFTLRLPDGVLPSGT